MTLFAPGRGDFLVFRSGYYNFVNKNHIESKANSKKIGACGEQNMFCHRMLINIIMSTQFSLFVRKITKL